MAIGDACGSLPRLRHFFWPQTILLLLLLLLLQCRIARREGLMPSTLLEEFHSLVKRLAEMEEAEKEIDLDDVPVLAAAAASYVLVMFVLVGGAGLVYACATVAAGSGLSVLHYLLRVGW